MPTQAIKEEFAHLRRERNRTLGGLAAVVVVVVCVTGWFGDHRSCQRSREIRQYLRDQIPVDQDALRYWIAQGEKVIADRVRQRLAIERQVRQLDCNSIFPGV